MKPIVAFAIVPSELSSPRNSFGAHRRLLKGWQRWGVLLADEGLRSAIRQRKFSTQEIQKLWASAWKAAENREYRVQFQQGELCNGGELSAHELEGISAIADLLVVDPSLLPEAGLAQTAPSPREGCALASLEDIDACPLILAAESAQQLDIPWDQEPGAVWESKFKTLSANARNIVITDRYALARHTQFDSATNRSGLRAFLEFVSGALQPGRRSSVRLFTSDSVPECARLDIHASARSLTAQSARDFRIDLDVHYSSELHDRWIRFDCTVCAIGSGLEVFEWPRRRKHYDFSLKSDPTFVASVKAKESQYMHVPSRRRT